MIPSPRLVCQDCSDEYYSTCEECGRRTAIDETRVIGDYVYCDECVSEHFTICEYCDEYVRLDDAYETTHGGYVCGHCRDYYYNTCDNCGREIPLDEAYYADDDECEEYPLCRRCYENGGYCEINSYGYKPEPYFNRLKNEKKTKEFFGMEIEVEGQVKYAKGFKEFFPLSQIYLKKDGSVNGFEIVTHPMTRRYFYSKFVPNLEKGMKFLRQNGFRGHNRAGIHIHVSDEAISMEQLKKLMCLLYPEQKSIYKKWLAITQRHDDKMQQWSRMIIDDKECTNSVKKKVKEEIDYRQKKGYGGKPEIDNTRYTAINMRNNDTIEFRIFNSNIRTERIIKNMQVIFSLLDFTKTDKLPTFHNYMRFVEENRGDYRELWEFLLEKGIYQPSIEKAQLKEIIKAIKTVDSEIIDYGTAIEKLRALEPKTVEGIDDNDEIEGGLPCVSQF